MLWHALDLTLCLLLSVDIYLNLKAGNYKF